ncbi:hypothetical protein RhiJN_19057 [Ceratobasidium sp. AG-Ba]|nr:hypothetical protein RhiJN_04237 [Ceratobasidium sp. AG-Ba]QRV91039.1 hypothetical protein RhiJN_19057 [Ceratobasidium sp. AG-Ba]QRW05130.1 hypothetical protein RhiLY_04129 [Ceratobasidium sp. AG-Ba]
MSTKSESMRGTPISVHAMAPSDSEPALTLDGARDSKGRSGSCPVKPPHPEFSFIDGSVEIETNDCLFRVHEFQLNNFTVFSHLIKQARGDPSCFTFGEPTKILCDQSSTDFANTFRVLYTSGVTGSLVFSASILRSTLRIATVYNYPGLREFAIAGLEKLGLSAIERIQLSDEFLLPSWEKSAFTELCRRPDPITPSEAQLLGVDRLVEVARIREAEQHRKFASTLIESFKKHTLIKSSSEAPAIAKFKDKGPAGKNIPASLPNCDCKVQEDKDKKQFVAKCKQHEVAPQILTECQSLLKEHSKLADGVNELGKVIFSKHPSNVNTAGGVSDASFLETELNKASLIRSSANN